MAIRGSHDKTGLVTISWSSQSQVLLAPGGLIYLPCNHCGILLIVPSNTASVNCDPCAFHLQHCEDDPEICSHEAHTF